MIGSSHFQKDGFDLSDTGQLNEMVEHPASFATMAEFGPDAQVQNMGGISFDSHDGVDLDKTLLFEYTAAVP